MPDDVARWNDQMYEKHPTPYTGLAGAVERLRVRHVRSLAAVTPGDTVLEVGCEAGGLMASLPQARRLVGADISSAALRDASRRFRNLDRPAVFCQCDATSALPFTRGAFSVIICSEMLEHVSEPAKAIDSIRAIATPATRIVLSVPNEKPKVRIKEVLRRIGFIRIFMPGIEEAQSEWHLQAFSRPGLLHLLAGKLRVETCRIVLGLHVVALCRVPPADGDSSALGTCVRSASPPERRQCEAQPQASRADDS
jgi:ubiquinone/menaquinone biosynthesis C-methylase UbiE